MSKQQEDNALGISVLLLVSLIKSESDKVQSAITELKTEISKNTELTNKQ